MKTLFNIVHNTDIYEVALQGRLITRITKYFGGSQRFVEIHDWDTLPEDVQHLIEKDAKKLVNE